MDINERRQALLPKLREEKRKNNRAFISNDKLYVNGIPWNPPPNVPDDFQQRNGPNPGPVIWGRPTRGRNAGASCPKFPK